MKFSLRNLLIAFTVLAVAFGYFQQKYQYVQGTFNSLRQQELRISSGRRGGGLLHRLSESLWPTNIVIDVRGDLDDEVWKEISKLERLDELNVLEWQSDPAVYRHLVGMESIREISIEGPPDSIFEFLGELGGLEDLSLTWDNGDSPDFLGTNARLLTKHKNLRVLNFSYTSITDETMKSVAQVSTLEELFLMGTDIGDQGIAYLADSGEMRNLTTLNLRESNVTERCMDDLAQLHRLKQLKITSTKMGYDTTLAVSKLKGLPLESLWLGSAYSLPDGTLELQSVFPNCVIDVRYRVPVFGKYLTPEERARVAERELKIKEAEEKKQREDLKNYVDDPDPFR